METLENKNPNYKEIPLSIYRLYDDKLYFYHLIEKLNNYITNIPTYNTNKIWEIYNYMLGILEMYEISAQKSKISPCVILDDLFDPDEDFGYIDLNDLKNFSKEQWTKHLDQLKDIILKYAGYTSALSDYIPNSKWVRYKRYFELLKQPNEITVNKNNNASEKNPDLASEYLNLCYLLHAHYTYWKYNEEDMEETIDFITPTILDMIENIDRERISSLSEPEIIEELKQLEKILYIFNSLSKEYDISHDDIIRYAKIIERKERNEQ